MTIRLHFHGDGPRDDAAVPVFVRRLLEEHLSRPVSFDPVCKRWARLHGRGFERKLLFAVTAARDAHAHGVVATVDRDKSPRRSRLGDLHAGRQLARSRGMTTPIALGEANPHGERWLCSDWKAVQVVLGVRHARPKSPRSPKELIEALHAASSRSGERPVDVWPEIAARSDLAVLEADRDSGFASLANDVRQELGSL